jgi:hypothetical protein
LEGIPGAPERGEGAGKMANAPPPDEFQFMLMYFCNRLNTDTESELHTHARCRDYVGIPGTAGYLEVVDPVLFLGGLSKDMTKCKEGSEDDLG